MNDPAILAAQTFQAAADKLDVVMAAEPAIGSAAYSDWSELHDLAGAAYDSAFGAMIAAEPSTKAGAIAVLDLFMEYRLPYLDAPIPHLETLIHRLTQL
jgi:hypothetical protein